VTRCENLEKIKRDKELRLYGSQDQDSDGVLSHAMAPRGVWFFANCPREQQEADDKNTTSSGSGDPAPQLDDVEEQRSAYLRTASVVEGAAVPLPARRPPSPVKVAGTTTASRPRPQGLIVDNKNCTAGTNVYCITEDVRVLLPSIDDYDGRAKGWRTCTWVLFQVADVLEHNYRQVKYAIVVESSPEYYWFLSRSLPDQDLSVDHVVEPAPGAGAGEQSTSTAEQLQGRGVADSTARTDKTNPSVAHCRLVKRKVIQQSLDASSGSSVSSPVSAGAGGSFADNVVVLQEDSFVSFRQRLSKRNAGAGAGAGAGSMLHLPGDVGGGFEGEDPDPRRYFYDTRYSSLPGFDPKARSSGVTGGTADAANETREDSAALHPLPTYYSTAEEDEEHSPHVRSRNRGDTDEQLDPSASDAAVAQKQNQQSFDANKQRAEQMKNPADECVISQAFGTQQDHDQRTAAGDYSPQAIKREKEVIPDLSVVVSRSGRVVDFVPAGTSGTSPVPRPLQPVEIRAFDEEGRPRRSFYKDFADEQERRAILAERGDEMSNTNNAERPSVSGPEDGDDVVKKAAAAAEAALSASIKVDKSKPNDAEFRRLFGENPATAPGAASPAAAPTEQTKGPPPAPAAANTRVQPTPTASPATSQPEAGAAGVTWSAVDVAETNTLVSVFVIPPHGCCITFSPDTNPVFPLVGEIPTTPTQAPAAATNSARKNENKIVAGAEREARFLEEAAAGVPRQTSPALVEREVRKITDKRRENSGIVQLYRHKVSLMRFRIWAEKKKQAVKLNEAEQIR